MSLSDIKGAMEAIWTLVRKGDGSDEFNDCLHGKIKGEQHSKPVEAIRAPRLREGHQVYRGRLPGSEVGREIADGRSRLL